MKRIQSIIYLLLLLSLTQLSCDKSSDSGPKSPTSGAGGSLARFAISGNYLYTVDFSTIRIFDITDPANPLDKGMVNAGWDIETIFPYKDKLFLGGATGMYVFSIADPLKPTREGMVTHFRACDPVVANDTVSYVTLRSGGPGSCGGTNNVLNVYDVKIASSPNLVRTISMKSPYGLGIKNKGLYVCEGANGMVVFDLSDPYTPVQKQVITNETFYDVIPYGNLLIAYIEKGVCFYDISNPFSPVLLGKLKG
ncbi:MAG TPA: hypothetical protein VD996_16935 [Chitinophagaceae bacterium]|nr:hypothetical protein [Chitinophagaceae bacterium]